MKIESDFISEWLFGMHPNITSVMTSGVGIKYNHSTIWVWEHSNKFINFTKWFTGKWYNECNWLMFMVLPRLKVIDFHIQGGRMICRALLKSETAPDVLFWSETFLAHILTIVTTRPFVYQIIFSGVLKIAVSPIRIHIFAKNLIYPMVPKIFKYFAKYKYLILM